MAKQVDILQSVFRSVESKLDVVMCQVEESFARFDSHQQAMSGAIDNHTRLNPVKILSDLKQVSDDFTKASTEYEKLKESVSARNQSLLKEQQALAEEINSTLSQLKH